MTKYRSISLAVSTAALLALLIPSTVQAAENWTGAADSDWNNAGNWSGAAVPNNEPTTIDDATNNPVTLNTAAAFSITNLNLGVTVPASFTLNTNGNLNVTNAGSSVIVGVNAGGAGILTLDGAGTTLTVNGGLGSLLLGQDVGSTGTLNLGNGGAAGTLNAASINGGAGTAIVNFNDTVNYSLGSQLTGSVQVNQIGTAVTTLTNGANNYTGATTVTAGTLRGGVTNAFSANSANTIAGTLDVGGFNQTIGSLAGGSTGVVTNLGGASAILTTGGLNTSTTFAGVIQDGTQIIGLTKNGTGVQTLSGVDTYSGLTTINGGTLIFTNNTSGLGGNIVDNAALIFNQAANSSFSGAIDGPGTLTKNGAGFLTLSGVSSVGLTSVNAGGLLVDNSLQATQVNVAAGALLGGHGTVISNVSNAGTLSPGDSSPGTLNIRGNYTQTSSGIFQLQIASRSDFDRLIITGRASLAGLLNAAAYNGYKPSAGDQFPFLTANGGISGKFQTITGDFSSSYRLRLFTEQNTVVLVFAPQKYESEAITQNQRNVAKALDPFIKATSGDRSAVSLGLDQLTSSEYPAAFNAISPAQYEALANTTIEEYNGQDQLLQQRFGSLGLTSNRGFQVMGLNRAALSYDKDGKSVMDAKSGKDVLTPSPENNWGVWVQGNGIFAHNGSVNDVPSYHFDTGGVLVGADYCWNESFTTGLFGGYQGTSAHYANGGKSTINAARFGLYASYDPHNGFYANAVVSGGYSAYTVRRPISFGTIDRTATSSPDGGEFNAALDLGYDWKVSHFTFGPIVTGQYTYVGIAPFSENGADSLDLDVGQQNANSIRSSLGGHIAYTWQLTDQIAIIPEGRMFWQHEYLDGSRNIESTIDGGSGASFAYSTASPDRDVVYAGAGVTVQIGQQWTVNAFYNADFGRSDFVSHMVSGGVNFNF